MFHNIDRNTFLGYFADVTSEAGLGSHPHPRTNADERAGLTNMLPYRIKNVGLFKDVMPGPFSLSALFTDIDFDGTYISQMDRQRKFERHNKVNNSCLMRLF